MQHYLGNKLRKGEKRALRILLLLILFANAIVLASAILIQNLLVIMICVGVVAFDLYWSYVRYYLRRRSKYPLVPLEGKPDIYLPRTNIPRPIYEDLRKMKEKKRKLEKIEKMTRNKK